MIHRLALSIACLTLELSAAGLAAPCPSGPVALCLNGQRFAVEVSWRDFQGNSGTGQAVALTSDTGYFWFFDPANVELVVKILDGRALNGHFWVFYGALSSVEYEIAVHDTVSGEVKRYRNPSGRLGSVADTSAFASPHGARAPARWEAVPAPAGNATGGVEASCQPSDTALCLSRSRYRLEVSWRDFQGRTGTGRAVQLTPDTGYFWFFDSANVELIAKVLDGRPLNGHAWVFYGALSSVEYTLTVTDTLTGLQSVYRNRSGNLASVADTTALPAGFSVAATLDEDRAASQRIGPEGGEVRAAAENGAAFTLTIPANALLSPEVITLTPVAAIARLPLSGGLAAAVKVGPEGLRLLEPATLAIDLPAALLPAEETTFAFRGEGEEFVLHPPVLRFPRPASYTRHLELYLLHFGGAGMGRGTQAERQAQLQRKPATREDEFLQELASITLDERRRQLAGALVSGPGLAAGAADVDEPSRSFLEKSEALARAYWNEEIAPNLARAEKDCDFAVKLIPKALSWARQVTLLGLAEEPAFEDEIRRVFAAYIAAEANCYDEAHRKCVDQKEPHRVSDMLRSLRALELLGAGDRVDQAKIKGCLRFELEFDSFLSQIGFAGPDSTRYRARAVVPVEGWQYSEAGDLVISGSGPIELQVEADPIPPYPNGPHCTTQTSAHASTFTVDDVVMRVNRFEDPSPRTVVMELVHYLGHPLSRIVLICDGQVASDTGMMDVFAGMFTGLHLDEGVTVDGRFHARDWSSGAGALLARKTYQRSELIRSETTIMNFWHRPQ